MGLISRICSVYEFISDDFIFSYFLSNFLSLEVNPKSNGWLHTPPNKDSESVVSRQNHTSYPSIRSTYVRIKFDGFGRLSKGRNHSQQYMLLLAPPDTRTGEEEEEPREPPIECADFSATAYITREGG